VNAFQQGGLVQEEKRIIIVGKPNSGKSLLFNRLTGLQQQVANFPGVTVEVKIGRGAGVTYLDFPGVYSLNPITRDEEVAVNKLKKGLCDPRVHGLICILDATRLERSLLLGLQIQRIAAENNKSLIFVVNMMDEIARNKARVNCHELEKAIGVPAVPISAKTGLGLDVLKSCVQKMCAERNAYPVPLDRLTPVESIGSQSKELNAKCGPDTDVILKNQNWLDRFFLSSFWGGVAFAAIMIFLFQAIFSWSAPFMDLVESVIGTAGGWVSSILPAGILADFMNEALFGGFGSFLVFVPQIFVLTFIIGVLEDSGYLVRAAIICHKPLSYFGLSGRSFIPLLSGHACAIPAIFATRMIESPKRRLLTIIGLPLLSCSARLPVYSLLITALIPPITYAGGIFGLQGFTFFALYAFGLVTALVVTGVLAKTVYRKESDAPFVLELPPYRVPSWKPLIKRSVNSAWTFVTKAGGMIFAVTVVVWILGYFPNGSGQLSTSWLASIGKWIEPVFAPIGLDWKFGVAILASFLAREVFVGTLGTLLGIEGAEENLPDLASRIQASGFTLASGLALLVFYALAMQCVSTLAVIRKETGNLKLPTYIFLGYSALAYIAALVTYEIAKLF
jgi:ferrous iron transport protein B